MGACRNPHGALALAALLSSCGAIPEGRFQCATDDDCPASWLCLGQRCYSHAPDAGQADAGRNDSGVADAGIDSGRLDAGPPDACVLSIEVCNNVDDDCDGSIDEGMPDQVCGIGPCARTVPGCAGGTVPVCTPGPAGAETCPPNGADDNCDGAVDNVDCSHVVLCRVFSSPGVGASAFTDAISTPMPDMSCAGSGGCGQWMACQTTPAGDGHAHTVLFRLFDTGYVNQAGPAEYVRIDGLCRACFTDGTCRGWFGLATTTIVQGHTHDIVCDIFNNGYASPIGPSDALNYNCTARQYVVGGRPADLRQWWGRCHLR